MKSLTRWEPFRMMKRWDPVDELRTMQHDMDRLFDHFFGAERSDTRTSYWTPSIESYLKDGKLVFRAELPGVDPKGLDVSITERELVIKGERKAEKSSTEESYLYREISYGSFERRFTLPEGAKIDDLKATYTNGILEVTVPVPAVAKARKIEIETPKEEHKLVSDQGAKKAA